MQLEVELEDSKGCHFFEDEELTVSYSAQNTFEIEKNNVWTII